MRFSPLLVAVYSDNSLFRRASSSHRLIHAIWALLNRLQHGKQVWGGSWGGSHDGIMRPVSSSEGQRQTFLVWRGTGKMTFLWNTRHQTPHTCQEINEGAKTGWQVGNHNLRITDTHRKHPETPGLPSGDNTVLKMRPLCRGRRPADAWIINEGQAWVKTKRVQVGCEPLP